jgi:hypothetical protein
MEKDHKFFHNEPAYHAAKEAEKWMLEAERLKSELLHRDVIVLLEKNAEYERLKQSMDLDIKVRERRIDDQNITITHLHGLCVRLLKGLELTFQQIEPYKGSSLDRYNEIKNLIKEASIEL